MNNRVNILLKAHIDPLSPNIHIQILQTDLYTFPYRMQRAKKVVSDSLGLVDFAIGLVSSVINLPDSQEKIFEEFKLQKYCQINLLIKTFLG